MDVNIELTTDTTEYYVMPNKENVKTVFCIQDKAMVISFCNFENTPISQSEISIEDAHKLAKYINQINK